MVYCGALIYMVYYGALIYMVYYGVWVRQNLYMIDNNFILLRISYTKTNNINNLLKDEFYGKT